MPKPASGRDRAEVRRADFGLSTRRAARVAEMACTHESREAGSRVHCASRNATLGSCLGGAPAVVPHSVSETTVRRFGLTRVVAMGAAVPVRRSLRPPSEAAKGRLSEACAAAPPPPRCSALSPSPPAATRWALTKAHSCGARVREPRPYQEATCATAAAGSALSVNAAVEARSAMLSVKRPQAAARSSNVASVAVRGILEVGGERERATRIYKAACAGAT